MRRRISGFRQNFISVFPDFPWLFVAKTMPLSSKLIVDKQKELYGDYKNIKSQSLGQKSK